MAGYVGVSALQARKNATALRFERAPEAWLAHPREASEFERALRAGEITAVGVNGSLVLYTDRGGRQFSTRLIDCGPNCRSELGSRLGELSLAQGFALTDVDVDPRTASERLSRRWWPTCSTPAASSASASSRAARRWA